MLLKNVGQSVLSHWRLIFIIRYGAMVIIRTNKERKKNILWSGVRERGKKNVSVFNGKEKLYTNIRNALPPGRRHTKPPLTRTNERTNERREKTHGDRQAKFGVPIHPP